ncbi:metal ABC transporter permease [Geodermatophilus sp. DSM 44513]|uniref:metal ABC transporter permease n=1 Tax=Geodermatophilus sp. DSM 44513 TaxID=1528104 RepID=UPI00127D1825|nr:metal ABC transporter permease [Geodermatophilus sp. DSM 44513]WNV76953.1 metal ABC transporter permease [Geodermatophilus sp. DSM 44513]
MLSHGFMWHALVAAVLAGVVAPTIGVHLVQRRMSVVGDGIGHVALAGVALGVVTGAAPVGTAVVVAVAGAVAVELLRGVRRTEVDTLLAILSVGGVAGGVVLLSAVPAGRTADLDAYLFGSVLTTTRGELVVLAGAAAAVLMVTVGLHRALFAVSLDEECACAAGLPVRWLGLLLAATTAATVVASMRVLGLLLVSALMVLPAAAATLLARSCRGTLALAVVIGGLCAVAGTTAAYTAGLPAGGAIVLLCVAVFTAATVVPGARRCACRVLGTRAGHRPARPAEVPALRSRVGLLP